MLRMSVQHSHEGEVQDISQCQPSMDIGMDGPFGDLGAGTAPPAAQEGDVALQAGIFLMLCCQLQFVFDCLCMSAVVVWTLYPRR